MRAGRRKDGREGERLGLRKEDREGEREKEGGREREKLTCPFLSLPLILSLSLYVFVLSIDCIKLVHKIEKNT